MTDHIKRKIQGYRQKTERPSRTEMLNFRVTPEEKDILMAVYGSPVGIRDFALASTDTVIHEIDAEYRLKSDKAEDQDADQG